MDQELQKYYEDRFDLFSRPGWVDIIEDVDNMLMALNNVSTIADEKSLQFRKGEISILTWLVTLKEISERAYEDLNEKNIWICLVISAPSINLEGWSGNFPSSWLKFDQKHRDKLKAERKANQ